MNINYSEAAKLLRECGNAYILIHQSPDGDCIGSGTALYYLLRSMGKKARVICHDEIPQRYSFMREDYRDEEFEPDFIIAADVADINLLGDYKEKYGSRVDLCIDHHISNTGYAKRLLLDPDASSACEVLYEVIREMGIPADDRLTKCIYTGIATDTGCFKYENTGARAHEIAAELKRNSSVSFAKINRAMFEIKSRGRIKLETEAFKSMEYFLDGKCTMITITLDMLKDADAVPAELEGLAGIPLQVEGAEVGVTVKQRDEDSYKISMRSANEANVSDICASLGGGGHIRAAGCLLHGSLDEVKKTIVEAVRKGLGL